MLLLETVFVGWVRCYLMDCSTAAPPDVPSPWPCAACSYDEPILNEGAIKALKSIFSFGKKDD